jgi:hypothetical protein
MGKEITQGQLWKMVSFATDTCPTNQNVWIRFANNPKTKHIITVPCDSHSIQLLIKDLLLYVPAIKRSLGSSFSYC